MAFFTSGCAMQATRSSPGPTTTARPGRGTTGNSRVALAARPSLISEETMAQRATVSFTFTPLTRTALMKPPTGLCWRGCQKTKSRAGITTSFSSSSMRRAPRFGRRTSRSVAGCFQIRAVAIAQASLTTARSSDIFGARPCRAAMRGSPVGSASTMHPSRGAR